MKRLSVLAPWVVPVGLIALWEVAAQVGWLFEPHTTEVVASTGVGFDRLVVTVAGRKPLSFNAEEPDRFM